MGVSPLKQAGKLVFDPREQAQLLNIQFHSVFSPKENISAKEFDHRCPPAPNFPKYPECDDIKISNAGVEKLLFSLDPNKAWGPDGITPRLLKTVAKEITPALTLLFQNSYSSGTLPLDWRQANITPVFKKGEKYKVANYRPMSLTCIACKLMEHIVTSHIMTHFAAWLPLRKIVWNPTLGICGWDQQRVRERKSRRHDCPWLRKSFRQGESLSAGAQATTIWCWGPHKRLDQGLSQGQTTGCGGGGNQIRPPASRIRSSSRLCPWTKPLLYIYKWSPGRYTIQDPIICWRYNVYQDHNKKKRWTDAPKGSAFPYHLGTKVVHGISSTEMHCTESL